MKIDQAVAALSALAQDKRLAVFRLLMRAGPDGLPAGQVARRLAIAPATLSFHFKELDRAGLLRSRRAGRQIFYAVDIAAVGRLMRYLTEDCCRGHPDVCAPYLTASDDPIAPQQPNQGVP